MLDQLNSLDVDTQRATLTAVTIVALLLLVCCLSKWLLYAFTGIFSIYALFLAYKIFIEPQRLKKGVKSNVKT